MKRAPHIQCNEATFRAEKRMYFGLSKHYLRKFGYGSAFVPREAFKLVFDARQLLDQAHEILKPWWKKSYYRARGA